MTIRTTLLLTLAASIAHAQEEPPPEEAPPVEAGESEPETSEPETSEPETSEPETDEPETSEPEIGDLEEDIGDLEELLEERVVTTASLGAERASAAPATVFTITAREMRIYGMRSIDEALLYLGVGVYVMRPRDYTTGIDIGAQGLIQRDGGRHVLALLDGHVMNSQDTGTVTLHEGFGVPLEAIDHIEVMLGAGSVVYGSNAMLAVVNVVTRDAERGSHIEAVVELGVAPPMDEAGLPTVPDAMPGDRAGFRYRLGAGFHTTFDVFRAPATLTVRAEWLEEINNSYRIPAFSGENFDLRPGETEWGGAAYHTMRAPSVVASLNIGDFRLAFQANHYYRNMPLSGIFNDPAAREERNAMRAELRHAVSLVPQVALSTRFYADWVSFAERTLWRAEYWCFEGQVDGCQFESRSVGRWAGLEQVISIDWNLDAAIVTTIGYDVRGRDTTARPADTVDFYTGALPYTTSLPYVHQVSVLGSVYAQQVIRPWEWLTVNGGARLDMDSSFGIRLSPRAAVVVTPIEGTVVRASYAEAFRAPTAYELYENDRTYRISALDLRPEVVRTVELEWQQRFEFLTFSLRGFLAFYEDFIDTRDATDEEKRQADARGEISSTADLAYLVRYDNLQALRSFGGTLSLMLRPVRGLTIAGSITIADTRVGEQAISLAPLWSGNARISYELAPNGASFALAAVFAGRRIAFEDLFASELHEVGEQLDLRATVSSPIELVPGLSFRATVSYAVNPFQPYLINAPTETEPEAPVVFSPVTSSLFGFLGVQYDLSI